MKLPTTHYVTAILTLALTSPSAMGALSFQGELSAYFSHPTLSGNIITVSGTPQYFDNSASAITTGLGTNVFTWGTSNIEPGFSFLSFVPNTSYVTTPDAPFSLGTLRFYNGTSELSSLVFGVDLVITSNDPNVAPLVIPISITTTQNNGEMVHDADSLDFVGIPSRLSAFEGFAVVADVTGAIIGDPILVAKGLSLRNEAGVFRENGDGKLDVATDFVYTSGIAGGFVTPVPEPSSLVALISLVGFIPLLRQRPRLQ